MDRLIVACVQERMRLPETLEDYREDLRRFLRIAATKRAGLVVFPELAGAMIAPPLLKDFRSTLVKRADQGMRRRASFPQRLTGLWAYYMANLLRADLRKTMAGLLDVAAADVWQAYADLFGSLAREFNLTIVAPSAYLPDPVDGVIRNLAAVFSNSGERLGYQAKVMLHSEDEGLAQPGSAWDVIATEVGSLGLILGGDALYPEVGRLLAYQGAELMIVLGACPTFELYQKVRTGALARMQDNQIFGIVSFLVGENPLARSQEEPFVGRSAILAPQELTPKRNGVLVEMGNQRSEGVLTAELDFGALKGLWESSDTPVRKTLPLEQAGKMLANLYQKLQLLPRLSGEKALPEGAESEAAPAQPAGAPASTDQIHLDDLPVISSLTSRWPLHGSNAKPKLPTEHLTDLAELPDNLLENLKVPELPPRKPGAGRSGVAEDETDEMDALPGASADRN
ncbi:MAG: nitrilase-related carbon-nitrogen hydrolase [Caldilineaceae bacterium]